MSKNINWNTRYDNGNDYIAATTQDINYLISHANLDAPKTALDIGCGTGQLCRELFHRGYKVAGVDVSSSAIGIAKQSTLTPTTDLEFILGNIEGDDSITYTLAPYGLITCRLVITFIQDKDALLQKVHSLLDGKGVFIVINPHPDYLPKEKQGITTPHKDMLNILEGYFRVESFERNKDYYYICRK